MRSREIEGCADAAPIEAGLIELMALECNGAVAAGAMTAEDVKFSFERIIDDALESTNRPDWGPLSHVEVTGERTGTIVLNNAFQPLWSITLPFLAPVIAITVLLRTVWVANFTDLIIVMTGGGPADRTQTVASYIFTQAFKRLDFGYASAISLVLLFLLLAYALLILLLRQRLIDRDK